MADGHSLVIAFDGEYITPRIVCHVKHLPADQRDCAMWEELMPFQEAECTCDDPECGCVDGDHGENHNWIADIGYECQCRVVLDCWYEYQTQQRHWSEVLDFERHEITLPIRIGAPRLTEDPIVVQFEKEGE